MATALAVTTSVLTALVGAAPAGAATAAPGYAVSDYVTAVPNNGRVGPVGLAFDSNAATANLYVMGYADGILYKFPPGGGAAGPVTAVNTVPIPGSPSGLAFSLDFAHLYLARQAAGDVVELDPSTGSIVRTVATGVPCATGIATDPLSGDLMVSELGCGSIWRIVPATGNKTLYANVRADGLTFDPRDGTLYAAVGGSTIAVVDRAGNVTTINPGPGAATLDGIALAASRVPGQAPFVFVNQNNGTISKVDLTTSPPTTTTVTTGGSRGDLVTVGPDGCLYATQTATVLKVTNADGTCSLAPPDPAITAEGSSASVVEGAPFSGSVGTFTDPDVTATAGEYSAVIHWGDGTSSTGMITATATPGQFSVAGTHTYAEEGSYTVQFDVVDVDTPSNAATATSPITVTDATITASGTNLTSPNPVSGVVAHFTDADPAGAVSDYSAVIDWGDGSTSSGSISAAGGGFDVSGAHTYAALGPYTVHVHICDSGGSCADATTQVLVFAFSSGGGTFVVGDQSATGTVTYWGAQWWKVNSLSGGAAPAAFKGFADSSSPAPPACGGTWTARPGNSSEPPAAVPTYLGVIVSSTVSQAGSTISGNVVHVIVVRTDPGYAANPGHAGTGTVVGVIC